MGTMLFYGAIHIAQQQTPKELIADANLLAQCERTLKVLTSKVVVPSGIPISSDVIHEPWVEGRAMSVWEPVAAEQRELLMLINEGLQLALYSIPGFNSHTLLSFVIQVTINLAL